MLVLLIMTIIFSEKKEHIDNHRIFVCQVLYCIVGDLPVVISCASLALADVGVMMYDLITTVPVVCVCYNSCTNSSAFPVKFISIR